MTPLKLGVSIFAAALCHIICFHGGTSAISCLVCVTNTTLEAVKENCPLTPCNETDTACKASYVPTPTEDGKKDSKLYTLTMMCIDPQRGHPACSKRPGINACMCKTDGCNTHEYDGCKCLGQVKAAPPPPPPENSQNPMPVDKIPGAFKPVAGGKLGGLGG